MLSIIQTGGYLLSALLFIIGLKKLRSQHSARTGNALSSLGMLVGVIAALVDQNILTFQWIITGIVLGTLIGGIAAQRVAMTAMPEMVALFNGCGGASSLLLALGSFYLTPNSSWGILGISALSMIIGSLTCSGSIIAWGKLAGFFPSRPLLFPGYRISLFLLVSLLCFGAYGLLSNLGNSNALLLIIIGSSLIIGIISVLTIGGGDMPVVIALLNSYSGIAAACAGAVIQHMVLVVAGILVGASGFILTIIMCKAMNRSLKQVLFGNYEKKAITSTKQTMHQEAKSISAEDCYYILEAARRVVIIPGYGMAVSQAQHQVKELASHLEHNGCEVFYAIHPVAGRMPGHMNVLLAEATIPYEKLYEMDDANPMMDEVDVCLVIGANDVVNPDAIENQDSPIYGMPIIEAFKAKTIIVLKRSLNPGFAGIDNPLFFKPNSRLLFGDAKTSINNLITQLKD